MIKHVYIHVPFCLKKCNYCSFLSYQDMSIIPQWIEAVHNELSLYQKGYDIKPETIYFGGGTPSLIEPEILQRIITKLAPQTDSEITIEVNPISISSDYLNKLNDTEINRISMGVQSFDDRNLKMLGRLHDSQRAIKAFDLIRKQSYCNVSLDLIYGLPDQNIADLVLDIKSLITLDPEHLSIYCLSLDRGVELYQKKELIPADEILSQMYEVIKSKFAEAGFAQYEISNFAKIGYESKHNLAYWSDKSYLGIGPAASGYLDKCRYSNHHDFNDYIAAVDKRIIKQNAEKISEDMHQKEFMFLGLRKVNGINLAEFFGTFDIELMDAFGDKLRKYLDMKLLKLEKGYLKLASEAYFISDAIFSDLM